MERRVIVELKSIEALVDDCKKPPLSYLKLTGPRLGLLIHFGFVCLKDDVVRVVNGLPNHPRIRS